MGKISAAATKKKHRGRSTNGGRKGACGDTTSPGYGQAIAVRPSYLCNIWWIKDISPPPLLFRAEALAANFPKEAQWYAGRRDFAFSRRTGSRVLQTTPSKTEGAGNAGCFSPHPRPRVQREGVHELLVTTGQAKSPAFPARGKIIIRIELHRAA